MEEKKIIAIIRDIPSEYILMLAEALEAGGITFMEITFNQKNQDSFSDTTKSIRCLTEKMGERIHVGAGTVTSKRLVEQAAEAGAEFIISPNTDEQVIGHTKALGLISIPGAFTPTEILRAHEAGADFIKVFPAEPFGAQYLKALKAPLNHIKLMAVGGINEHNLKEFLDNGACGAGIGGNLVNRQEIINQRFDRITGLAAKLTEIARSAE